MIVEFEPFINVLACQPSKWYLYYKNDDEPYFNKILLTYPQLKLFLETYGHESNNLLELQRFGIDITNIKYNKNL